MTYELLTRRRDVTKADLAMKLEIEDWHGVADAAMDLREIDAMIHLLPTLPVVDPVSPSHQFTPIYGIGGQGAALPHRHTYQRFAPEDTQLYCPCGAVMSA